MKTRIFLSLVTHILLIFHVNEFIGLLNGSCVLPKFSKPYDNYGRLKGKEFNVYFICPKCLTFSNNGTCLTLVSLENCLYSFIGIHVFLYLLLLTILFFYKQIYCIKRNHKG